MARPKTAPRPKKATHPIPKSTRRLLPLLAGRKRNGGAMARPAYTYTFMDDGHPGCSSADFMMPCLRQCPHKVNTITFAGRINSAPRDTRSVAELDGGLDGYNWKVRFEDDGPVYVLKLVR